MSTLSFVTGVVKNQVDVCFGNQKIPFSLDYYSRGKGAAEMRNAKSPYTEFNVWLAQQPKQWQEFVFNKFLEVREIIDTENDVDRMLQKLNTVFIEIYKDVNLTEIERWIVNPRTPVFVPTKTLSSYGHARQNSSRETTYEYEDYLQLVAYSLSLRLVTPVWGEIHKRLNSQFGKDFKEIYYLEILYKTSIYKCPAEERLRLFMAHTNVQADTNAVLVSGLSEEDLYNYMFAVIVLKRVALGDIAGSNDTYPLIIVIYYFFQTKMKQSSKSYGNAKEGIQLKRNPVEDKRGLENNSQSVLDVGYSRSRISTDDRVFMQMAINDHPRIISILEPEMPMQLYWDSVNKIRTDYQIDDYSEYRKYMKPVQDVQITLAKWILNDVVNQAVFDHLTLKEVIDVLGLVRAILWYRGFHDFAAVVSAIAMPINDNETFIPTTYRKNLEPKLVDELSKTYDLGGATKSEKRNMSHNGCIDIVESGISEFNWLLTLPNDWLQSEYINHQDNRLIVKPNIRNQIGHLMLDIANRQSMQMSVEF